MARRRKKRRQHTPMTKTVAPTPICGIAATCLILLCNYLQTRDIGEFLKCHSQLRRNIFLIYVPQRKWTQCMPREVSNSFFHLIKTFSMRDALYIPPNLTTIEFQGCFPLRRCWFPPSLTTMILGSDFTEPLEERCRQALLP